MEYHNVLPQFLDIENYTPNTFEYIPRSKCGQISERLENFPTLEDWMKIFYDSIKTFQKIASSDPKIRNAVQASERFAEKYRKKLDGVYQQVLDKEDNPNNELVNCLLLCKMREDALRDAGFYDPFYEIKRSENLKALAILPKVLEELDETCVPKKRWELALRGICAANIFDLGAKHTTDMYENGGVDFHDVRENGLLSRPWVVDDLDKLVERFCSSKVHTKAVLFVDNSGADIMLGIMPFARELLRQGTQVVIAANELPSINDITASELDIVLPDIAQQDDIICKAVADQRLKIISSGNDLPVIDLTKLSEELVTHAKDADLIVLEGMGRSIETNLKAKFSCDSVNIGMIKHPEVAACLGGRLFDCVIKFSPGVES